MGALKCRILAVAANVPASLPLLIRIRLTCTAIHIDVIIIIAFTLCSVFLSFPILVFTFILIIYFDSMRG